MAIRFVIAVAIFLWMVVNFGLFYLSSFAQPVIWLSAPFVVLGWLVLIALSSALHGIFVAALYHYATTGVSPVTFEEEMLRAAFRPKKSMFM